MQMLNAEMTWGQMRTRTVDDEIELDPLRQEDAFARHEFEKPFIDYLKQYEMGTPIKTPEGTECDLRWITQQTQEGLRAHFKVMYLGRYGGEVALHSRPTTISRTAMLAYHIAPDLQGKSIASRAARALCRIGFDELGLETIGVQIRTYNHRSKQLARSLGAIRYDGKLGITPDYINGHYKSILDYERWRITRQGFIRK